MQNSAPFRYVVKSNDGQYLSVKSDYSGYGNLTRTFVWLGDIELADTFSMEDFNSVKDQFPAGSVRLTRIIRQEV